MLPEESQTRAPGCPCFRQCEVLLLREAMERGLRLCLSGLETLVTL